MQSGVVTLSGRVLSSQIRNDALSLVRQTEGAVMAVDRLDKPEDVTSQLSPAVHSLKQLRRFEFTVGVSVDIDLGVARNIGLAALAVNPGLLAEPKPLLLVEDLGDSTVILKCLAWMDQTKHDFYKTRSQAIREVKEAFDNAGLEMPEPIYRIHIRDTAATSTGGEESGKLKPRKIPTAPDVEIQEEDLSADDTIDKQVELEQRKSKEENLLAEKHEDS